VKATETMPVISQIDFSFRKFNGKAFPTVMKMPIPAMKNNTFASSEGYVIPAKSRKMAIKTKLIMTLLLFTNSTPKWFQKIILSEKMGINKHNYQEREVQLQDFSRKGKQRPLFHEKIEVIILSLPPFS
jgi:hypothetical protein